MMASIGNDRHKETPKYQFLENCHKNDLNEVTDCLSCGTVQKQTDTCDEYHVPMKLSEFPQAPKLRGGGKPKHIKPKSPKYANTNNQELQKLITEEKSDEDTDFLPTKRQKINSVNLNRMIFNNIFWGFTKRLNIPVHIFHDRYWLFNHAFKVC